MIRHLIAPCVLSLSCLIVFADHKAVSKVFPIRDVEPATAVDANLPTQSQLLLPREQERVQVITPVFRDCGVAILGTEHGVVVKTAVRSGHRSFLLRALSGRVSYLVGYQWPRVNALATGYLLPRLRRSDSANRSFA